MPVESSGTPIPTEEPGAPSRRALEGAGYPTLEQPAETSEDAIVGLHGVGPSALETLREALGAHDASFREDV